MLWSFFDKAELFENSPKLSSFLQSCFKEELASSESEVEKLMQVLLFKFQELLKSLLLLDWNADRTEHTQEVKSIH